MVKYCLFLCILYVYVYSPGIKIASTEALRLLYPFFAYWALTHWVYFKKNLFVYLKDFRWLFFLLMYVVFITYVRNGTDYVHPLVLNAFDGYCISIWITYLYNKLNISKPFSEVVFKVTCIAALISLFLFLYPDLNSRVRDFMQLYDLNDLSDGYETLFEFRYYGFASALGGHYGVIQGLAFIYCFHYHKNFRSCLMSVIILISIMINARTGVVLPLAYLCYQAVVRINYRSWVFISVLISLVLFILINNTLLSNYSGTIEWAMEGVYQILDYFVGTNLAKGNTFEGLAQDHAIFPSGISGWIFGTGHDLYDQKLIHSDVGYWNQLYYGGIIMLILLAGFYLLTYYRLYKSCKTKVFLFMSVIVFGLLIMNYKGSIYFSNGLVRLYFLLYVYFTSSSCIKNS